MHEAEGSNGVLQNTMAREKLLDRFRKLAEQMRWHYGQIINGRKMQVCAIHLCLLCTPCCPAAAPRLTSPPSHTRSCFSRHSHLLTLSTPPLSRSRPSCPLYVRYQVPFPYFHLLQLLIVFNLTLISYASVPLAAWPLSMLANLVCTGECASGDPNLRPYSLIRL